MPYKDIEKRRAKDRRYYSANREKRRAANRKWEAENPEKLRASARIHRMNNIEKARAATRAWLQANPGRMNAITIRRRFRLEQRTPGWLDPRELDEIYRNRPTGAHVDQIVPLAGRTSDGYPVSGLHVPWNLQYLTPDENRSKGNRMRPHEER